MFSPFPPPKTISYVDEPLIGTLIAFKAPPRASSQLSAYQFIFARLSAEDKICVYVLMAKKRGVLNFRQVFEERRYSET